MPPRAQIVHARRALPAQGLTVVQVQAFLAKLPKGARITVEEGQLVALTRPASVKPGTALRLTLPPPLAGSRIYTAFRFTHKIDRLLDTVAYGSQISRDQLIEGWLTQAMAPLRPASLKHPSLASGQEPLPEHQDQVWSRGVYSAALMERLREAAASRDLSWNELVRRLLMHALMTQAGYPLAEVQAF